MEKMNESNYRTVEGEFLGHKLVLRTEESEEFANHVIRFVNQRLEESRKRLGAGATTQYAALLALIDLAEEYLKAKDRASAYQDQLKQKSETLFRELGLNLRDQ